MGGPCAVHAEHPEPQFMHARESAEPHQRVGYGRGGQLGHLTQALRGPRMDHPAPSVDYRPFGGCDHFRSAAELPRMAMNGGLIAAQIDLRRIGKVTLRLGYILGYVKQHTPDP